ncbi:MAG: glycosyltransferase [Paludibacter sp.]
MTPDHNPIMKTVGIFNDSFPPIMDGVSLTVQNYAYWLQKKNQPVCVITPKSPDYEDEEPYPVYRYSSIPIIGRKPYRLGFPNIDISFKSEIEHISFGLVHAHCPFTSGLLALQIAREHKIPLVATFHSKYRDDFERSFHNKNLAKLMLKEIIWFYEKADEVWIPQAAVEETLREYGYKGKVEVMDNGSDYSNSMPIVPIKKQARIELKITETEFVFLFVGQHIWEKNTRMIIESLALLKDIHFKMFFIGTGYAKDDLMQLVNDLGLDSKVEFLGVIYNRDELKKYYAAANLFLFPSIYDNAPLVVREAAALHTPAILVNGSTAAEKVIDNFNGFLIENSAESLALKIRELSILPKLIEETGQNAAHTIARSWESVTDEVLGRYKMLMERTWKR